MRLAIRLIKFKSPGQGVHAKGISTFEKLWKNTEIRLARLSCFTSDTEGLDR